MSLFDIEQNITEYRDNIKDDIQIDNEEFQKIMLCISNIINISYDIQLKYAKIGDMKNEIIKYDEKNQIEEILSDDDNVKNKKKKENNEDEDEEEEEKPKVKPRQTKRNIKKVKEEIKEEDDDEEEKPKKKAPIRKAPAKKTSIRKAPVKKNKKKEESEEEDNSSDSE